MERAPRHARWIVRIVELKAEGTFDRDTTAGSECPGKFDEFGSQMGAGFLRDFLLKIGLEAAGATGEFGVDFSRQLVAHRHPDQYAEEAQASAEHQCVPGGETKAY